ncbi:ADP-ribose pyrophosphatase YjhB (NUDIX family) [Deinobacterium chartae]|uniref:ADP-ribose pyrophosphatase YjhB (NUDIX family) n=1 Tax=Deinobacterium chartae TaxID=521158 RepID=A0A841I2Y0_9DEIO|nr:NUDIX domain-containing protein [Deinobacterium chartae]MBB6099374.1 ADP-ribose pyrophosphatase YjhB (NUDIX family) [Deinobacterium chartae]
MRHRISAAGVVVRDGALLLVRHHRPGHYDFWLPPGGGLEGAESVFEGAEREVLEETGLRVRAVRLLYVQEILEPGLRIFKSFVLCSETGGELSSGGRVGDERNFLVDARFLGPHELVKLELYPEVFRREFWDDLRAGFPETRYLGLHRATAV